MIPGTVYRVIRPLGAGGMGEVYEAEHELLGVRRALKVLTRRLADREDLAERLRIEARALARLKHPNLVEVNDLGTSSDGRVFFAMELLSGATLRDLLRRGGALREEQAVALATQVLDALDAAHQEGMVHRDVKPENIFVQRSGVVKLLDFGVAKALQGPGQVPVAALTAAGVAIGTPRYMSPEQAAGAPIDARSDVYAVGVVLHEMLSGQPPYAQLDALAAAVAAATRGLPSLDEVGAGHVSAEVRAVLERSTARDPGQRYPSAAAFAASLRLLTPRLSAAALERQHDKVTARYDAPLTSLMPLVDNLTDPDPTAVDHRALAASGPGRSPVAYTGAGLTAPGFATATGEGYARVMTSELDIAEPTAVRPVAEPTEALILRQSLPFDPRDMPTPTAVPPVAVRPSVPTPAPAPGAPLSGWQRRSWVALPVGMAVSALITWAAVRPAPAAAVAATAVTVTSVTTAPATPPTDTAPTPAASPAAVASVAPDVNTDPAPVASAAPVVSAGPRVAGAVSKPAGKPAGPVGKPAGPAKPAGRGKGPQMPGSGL